jgi:RNA-binding protein
MEIFARVPLSTTLSAKQRRVLRARAHHLNPVVSVGAAGLSSAVLAELGIALDEHELVKLRIAADDREQRKELIATLCRRAKAELIQRIGHTAVIYRKRPEEKPRASIKHT